MRNLANSTDGSAIDMTIERSTRGSRLFLLSLFLISAECLDSNISQSILLLFNSTSITASLTPSQELYEPPPMSPAANLTIVEGVNTVGAAALTFAHVDLNTSTLVVEIAQTGLTQVTNVGIYQAPADANGPQVQVQISMTSCYQSYWQPLLQKREMRHSFPSIHPQESRCIATRYDA